MLFSDHFKDICVATFEIMWKTLTLRMPKEKTTSVNICKLKAEKKTPSSHAVSSLTTFFWHFIAQTTNQLMDKII